MSMDEHTPAPKVTAEEVEAAARDDTPTPRLRRLLTEPTVFDA